MGVGAPNTRWAQHIPTLVGLGKGAAAGAPPYPTSPLRQVRGAVPRRSRRDSRHPGQAAGPGTAMSLEPHKPEIKSATRVTGGPATPRKGPPKFKQRQTRQFKSKPPKKGVQG